MRHATATRAAALLAVAVVAAALALALTQRHHHKAGDLQPAGQWYTALAAPYLPSAKPTRSPCGVVIGPRTKGVANPVIPCNVKIYVEYQGKQALTQVVDVGPDVSTRQFDVTQALARELGLVGTRQIRWRFAR